MVAAKSRAIHVVLVVEDAAPKDVEQYVRVVMYDDVFFGRGLECVAAGHDARQTLAATLDGCALSRR